HTSHSSISPLSLHDALPISVACLTRWTASGVRFSGSGLPAFGSTTLGISLTSGGLAGSPFLTTFSNLTLSVLATLVSALRHQSRSEEHTSELQSLAYLVCRR